jgi:hypothetical protein
MKPVGFDLVKPVLRELAKIRRNRHMLHHYGFLCYDIEETAEIYRKSMKAVSFLTVNCDSISKILHYLVTKDGCLIELIQNKKYDGEPFTAKLDHIGYTIDEDFKDLEQKDVIYIPELGAEVLFVDEYPVITELLKFEEGCDPWEQIEIE